MPVTRDSDSGPPAGRASAAKPEFPGGILLTKKLEERGARNAISDACTSVTCAMTGRNARAGRARAHLAMQGLRAEARRRIRLSLRLMLVSCYYIY